MILELFIPYHTKTKFKIIGAAAAAANLLLQFKIPEKKEDKLEGDDEFEDWGDEEKNDDKNNLYYNL